ncbi:MAG TPA: IPT/TIG domain-containing protein [Pyrinomonadaceae bacterium]|nr:IPT/TIG domain-containing protein [Pyrinomonadaceae bacterium]
MALFEGKTPAERNKMIAAMVLPALAFLFVLRMLFGGSDSPRPAPTNANTKARPSSSRPNPRDVAQAEEEAAAAYQLMREVTFVRPDFGGGEAGRNIFAFYVRPVPTPGAVAVVPPTPPPTPTPTPPILLASLTPQSVFAGTGGFTLQIAGDKFDPAARVYLDNQEMPTQYRSAQQLSATVPATAISGQGQRQVVVRTPDGQFFSNPQVLNIMQPPQPTYTYVGLLKHPRQNTAVLKDQRGELYSVREGDLVEGRFRVVSINEKALQLVDKDLNVKHSMAFIESRNSSPQTGRVPGSVQPPPPNAADDEEP